MSLTLSSPSSRPAAAGLPRVMTLGGSMAGLGGGLAMLLTGAIVAAVVGYDGWLEPHEIAAIVSRPVASAQPRFGAGPVLLGTAIHLLMAALLGALFGIMYHRILHLTTDFGLPVYSGLVYGVWLWVVNYFVVLPVLGAGRMETYAASFLVQHLIYGTVTGLFYIWLCPEPYHER